MRILVDNLATTSNTTVNGESENFPKEYMYNNTLIEKTRFTDYIDIDLGEAKSIDSIGFSADSDLVLQANSSESWTAPPYQLLLSDNVQFISESYRYWRITNSDLTTYPVSGYTSGTDADLTSPDDTYDTGSEFVPCDTLSTATYILIGDYSWTTAGAADTSSVWSGDSLGSSYGNVIISANSEDWNSFAASGSNGWKEIDLPLSASGDGLGGKVGYYYHSAGWQNVGNVDFEIGMNGSVYIANTGGSSNVGDNTKLIVRWDGVLGAAGGGTATDIPRPNS